MLQFLFTVFGAKTQRQPSPWSENFALLFLMSVYVVIILCSSLNELTVFSIFLKAMYMFYALALVCDDYFVPSLEKICEVNNFYN